MVNDSLPPSLSVKELKLGGEWYVIIAWPNGAFEHVEGFWTERDAADWIDHESAEWLQRHPKSRAGGITLNDSGRSSVCLPSARKAGGS